MNVKVRGGQILSREITPSGSKNSIVCLISASLLFDKPVTLKNIPEVTDVQKLITILESLGSKISWEKDKGVLSIDNSRISLNDLLKTNFADIRGTLLLWGPLLGRFGHVCFDTLPGGCTLGRRPLDAHYKAFSDLGVVINKNSETEIKMTAEKCRPATIWLSEMSPTVTENAIMLAVSIKGKTVIVGAASEPQVQDLCNFLNQSRADISGCGSSVLTVNGGKTLKAIEYEILLDHYEIATFLALGAATGGEVRVKNSIPDFFPAINNEFYKLGVEIEYEKNTAIVRAGQFKNDRVLPQQYPITVRSQPWPALPVDLLPVFIALSLATPNQHQFLFHNWMYESGLFWTSELIKFGANITMCDPHRVLVTSGNHLRGTTIEAPYIIRATVALVTAAMVAEGESTILNADTLYRGHAHFSDNLCRLGAVIEEI